MDEQRKAVTLATPFADVRLEVEVSDCHVRLLYVGTAEQLMEAGAVEPSMVEPAPAKQRPRVDSAGFYFMREVRWSGGTRRLRIARHITDLNFAAQLPGVPQGLAFPRLDWLDAHPGRVHVAVEKKISYGRHYTTRAVAGTIEALIKSGIPAKTFDLKWSAGRFRHHNWIKRDSLEGYVTIRRLMRGYFELEQTVNSASTTSLVSTDLAADRRRSASHLQLVWVNPASA